jgi:hypothetical protein
VALGYPQEVWNDDLTRYESAEGLRALYQRLGRPAASILYDITSTLISDVIDAAGGIEGAVFRIHEALDRLNEVYAEWSKATEPLSDGSGIGDPSAEEAWYAVEEMIFWCRTLCERLQRDPVVKGMPKQGLIPAMADGQRRNAVLAARETHLAPVMALRYLANLNLHQQTIPAGSKAGTIAAGVVVLRFPDPLDHPIAHRWELSYSGGRDVVGVADEVMAALERFMDAMLGAFEDNIPARLL